MSHHCPSCKRVLYNRRLTHCGYCNAPIPEALRFTPEEIATLDQMMAEMAERRREREREVEEEAKARRLDGSGAGAGIM